MENNLAVKVKIIDNRAALPQKVNSSENAGWDLYSIASVTVAPGCITRIKTGIALEIPSGWYGQILGRSGLASDGIVVLGGVIDSGYRWEIIVIVTNLSLDAMMLKPSSKIAQLVFLPVPVVDFAITQDLSESDRGNNGFGSSGK